MDIIQLKTINHNNRVVFTWGMFRDIQFAVKVGNRGDTVVLNGKPFCSVITDRDYGLVY